MKTTRSFNLLIIQAVKRDADFLISCHPDLRIIEWEDFRRALFQVEPWDDCASKINSVDGVFSSVNWLGGHSQPLFKRAVIRGFEKNGAFENLNNFPNFSEIFDQIDKAAKELKLDGYEHRNVRDHLKFVIYSFIERGEILNGKKGFTIQDFFSKEDIILNAPDEENDFVLGTVITDILRDLQRFYERNPVHPPALRTLIIVDECSRIFPARDAKKSYDHDPQSLMTRFVTTKRSSGLGLIAITQSPQSVPSWLTDNSAFVLAFPIGGEGRDRVKQLLNLTDEQSSYIDELPQYGTGIFRDRRFNRRYLVKVPGDLKIEPITKEQTAQIMGPYIQGMHAKLREAGDVAISKVDLDQIEKRARDQTVGILVLKMLKEDRFLHHTALVNKFRLEYGYAVRHTDSALQWLKEQGLIEVIRAKTKTKDADYYALTLKAQISLGIREDDRIAPPRFKHTLYRERVRNYEASQGYKAVSEYTEGEIEATINTESGRPLEILKRADVMVFKNGKKIAYEITLSFSNLVENVYKCLTLFNVDELIIVCERQKPELERAERIITQNVPSPMISRIRFLPVSHFS
jgi:hypothetical protein